MEASEELSPAADEDSLSVETNKTEHCVPKEPKRPPMASPSAPSFAALQQTNTRDFILLNIERQAASVLLQGKGSIQRPFIRESRHSTDEKKYNLNEHLKRIMEYHKAGYRTLVIIRGLPGSGKTMLARLIINMTVGLGSGENTAHIFSPHKFFLDNNISYNDTTYAEAARGWNQLNAGTALSHGRSPVVIDDTHAQCWEMAPYVRTAVQNGYAIVVIEPNTTFAKNPSHLAKKNTHNVTLREITKMKNMYKENLFAEQIIKTLKLSYPSKLTPPVMRNDPPIPLTAVKVVVKQTSKPMRVEKATAGTSVETDDHSINNSNFRVICTKPRNINISNVPPTETYTPDSKMINKSCMTDNDFDEMLNPSQNEVKNFEAYNSFKELFSNVPEVGLREIFNKCGDNPNFVSELILDPKHSSESDSSHECESSACNSDQSVVPETTATSTLPTKPGGFPDKGDEDIIGSLDDFFCQMKRNRNYSERPNLFGFPEAAEGRDEVSRNIEARGTSISEASQNVGVIGGHLTGRDLTGEGSQNMGHIGGFSTSEISRNIEAFPSTGRDSRNIGVIGEPSTGGAIRKMLSTGGAIRKVGKPGGSSTNGAIRKTGASVRSSSGESSLKMEAYGGSSTGLPSLYTGASCGAWTGGTSQKMGPPYEPSTGGAIRKTGAFGVTSGAAPAHNIPLRSNAALNRSSSNNDESDDNVPQMVDLHLDMNFIKQMDQMYLGHEVIYPSYTVPKMTLPVSMVAKLYASVLNSFDHQTQSQQEYRKILEKEDEQLAKKLMKEEMEMMEKGGKMSCREQIDMNLAQQLYNQEIKEFKNKPVDPGIQSKRDRLVKLFPEIKPDILHELLQAHDNIFVQTVESLLMSTGRSDIVKKKNGVNVFIVERERQKEVKQAKNLCREKRNTAIVEELEDQMMTVDTYRSEASMYLEAKNYCTLKVNECMRSRMNSASLYYIERVHFFKKQFQEVSRLASENLIQVQVKGRKYNCVLSIHSMPVDEALRALDTYLDQHIRVLRMIGCLGEKTVYVITGSEMHRPHDERPAILTPAVKRRLRECAIPYSDMPADGVLAVTINAAKNVDFDDEEALD